MTITITAAGTTVVTTHLIHLGLRYLPFQFVKHRSLRHRSTRRQSMDGSLFPLRLRQAAVNITIGLETTVQTRAIRHRTWARDGESAATARDRLAVERVAKRSSSGTPNSESVIEPGSGCRSKQASYEWRSSRNEISRKRSSSQRAKRTHRKLSVSVSRPIFASSG